MSREEPVGTPSDADRSPVRKARSKRGATAQPVVLTFLAPASRCNQRCPRCVITELLREPVTEAVLSPADFARFTEQFIESGVPIASVGFLGYEVTLPESWPYVETVFQFAQRHRLRRSLVTNGMLLDRWTRRLRDLDVHRISVSIDGSTADVNDPIRGLTGAFDATLRSVRRFVAAAPELADRIAIASCVYGERNFRSLLEMPKRLNALGIERWLLSTALVEQDGQARHMPATTTSRWLRELSTVADEHSVRAYVIDPPGAYDDAHGVRRLKTVPLDSLFRLDPAGFVRSGAQLLDVFDDKALPRWNPARDHAPHIAGYARQIGHLQANRSH